jgi:hypothetical protein
MLAFVLRSEIPLTRRLSLSTLVGFPCFSGSMIIFLKLWSKGLTRRKTRRAARSSIRFWIGVPVRHQRNWLFNAHTALNRLVDFSLIKCAEKPILAPICGEFNGKLLAYLHPRQLFATRRYAGIPVLCRLGLPRESHRWLTLCHCTIVLWHPVRVDPHDTHEHGK